MINMGIQERIDNLGFYNTNIIITDEQSAIIDKAIELISHFDKEDVSDGIHFFREQDCDGDEIGEETCDNDKCVQIAIKDLRKTLGKNKKIYTSFSHNDGNHENIGSCCTCGRPLNQYLTWVEYDFRHHKDNSITLQDLTYSRNAFDIRVILESMPSSDNRISDYGVYQNKIGNSIPLQESIHRQNIFVNEIVEYAKLIIKIIGADSKYCEIISNIAQENE